MSVTLEIVTDARRFADIKLAWHHLWQRSEGYIFQSHQWITGWLSGVRDRKIQLLIALAWDGDSLCGALPMAVHRRSGLRVLTWAAQLFSDYCDGLVDPAGNRCDLIQRLWDRIYQTGGFDLIRLHQIRPDAKCRLFFDQMTQNGSRIKLADRDERCMRIENHWGNGESFFRSLNKKGRNNYTRGKRILAELGGDVRFRILRPPEDAGPTIEEIMRLKQSWLAANDPTSPLLGNDQHVLQAVLVEAWRSGLTKIFILESGHNIAAVSINFVYNNRMEAYFTAYDPAFDRASPGTILIVEYARWAFDNGLIHVDFLRG